MERSSCQQNRNKALVRRFMQSYNDREMEIFEELVAEDYIDHVFEQTGRDALKSLFTMAFEGSPTGTRPSRTSSPRTTGCGSCVRATGTHTGDWDLLGVKLPATGKSVELEHGLHLAHRRWPDRRRLGARRQHAVPPGARRGGQGSASRSRRSSASAATPRLRRTATGHHGTPIPARPGGATNPDAG